MHKSSYRLPRLGACLLAAALIACSKGEKAPEPEAATPAEPIAYQPLTDAELLGMKREQVTLTMPWANWVVSRDPAPNSAKATLNAVETKGGATFDRTVFEFGADTDFPGYRVSWDDAANATCAAEKAPDLGKGRTLVLRFQPASARTVTNQKTIAEPSRRPGLPTVATARMLCDDGGKVVWALGTTDSTAVRLLELRDPPRLAVDVAHKGAKR